MFHMRQLGYNARVQITDLVCYAQITNTKCNNECMSLTPIPTFAVFVMQILINTHKHSHRLSNRPNHHRTANTNNTNNVTETNNIFKALFNTHFLAHTCVTHVSIRHNKCSVLCIISTFWNVCFTQPCTHCWLHKAFCPQCTYGNCCAMLSTVWRGGAEATASKPAQKLIALVQNKSKNKLLAHYECPLDWLWNHSPLRRSASLTVGSRRTKHTSSTLLLFGVPRTSARCKQTSNAFERNIHPCPGTSNRCWCT